MNLAQHLRWLKLFACGLDSADFAFFAADAAGQLTSAHSTRRGVIALRKFEPGETLMSVSLDRVFSVDSIRQSRLGHVLPTMRRLGMSDMAVLVVALM